MTKISLHQNIDSNIIGRLFEMKAFDFKNNSTYSVCGMIINQSKIAENAWMIDYYLFQEKTKHCNKIITQRQVEDLINGFSYQLFKNVYMSFIDI